MKPELVIALLGSTVISGIVSSLIAGGAAIRSKATEYKHAYFMIVLHRRVAAYEAIERLIVSIKGAVLGSDARPYHLLFTKDDGHTEVYSQLQDVLCQSLWITSDLSEVVRKLNVLIYEGVGSRGDLVEFGKNNYLTIGKMRTTMENLHKRDMLVLHEVEQFLQEKSPGDSYRSVTATD